jgi:hypothetical protein
MIVIGLLLGTYIETIFKGFLSAGLQNNSIERKDSHVTKYIVHILGYVICLYLLIHNYTYIIFLNIQFLFHI